MTERAEFSPTEQSIFRGNRLEKMMLRRISNAALRLPEEFDKKGRAGKLHVHGATSGNHTATLITIEESITGEGDLVTRFTDIDLDRSQADPGAITALKAKRYVTDDLGDLHGARGPRERFTLGDRDSDLSMFRVMRYVTLAAQTVEGALTLEYLSSADPERTYPQLF